MSDIRTILLEEQIRTLSWTVPPLVIVPLQVSEVHSA